MPYKPVFYFKQSCEVWQLWCTFVIYMCTRKHSSKTTERSIRLGPDVRFPVSPLRPPRSIRLEFSKLMVFIKSHFKNLITIIKSTRCVFYNWKVWHLKCAHDIAVTEHKPSLDQVWKIENVNATNIPAKSDNSSYRKHHLGGNDIHFCSEKMPKVLFEVSLFFF